MPQQIDVNVQRLAALNVYLQFILELCPEPEADEDALMLVLVAFQKTLERRISRRLPTVEWNNIQRWSVAEANKLIAVIYDMEFSAVDGWNPLTEKPSNLIQNLAAVLMTLTHELLDDIRESEVYLANQLTMAAEEFAREIWAEHEAGRIE